ncbi:MAG TPA: carboxypeptidase-like regulatory domain-containing protein [Candidatus Aquilonibacter sp.]|nr:carboxypeptidase-like regulatory domain-containing protein [Candidatus Aquilonibacter sp.]
MRSTARVLVLLAAFFLALQAVSFGQSATSSLRGTIADAKGLVIPGATVVLSNAATGFSRTTMTDSQGVYQFLEVPPATYVLTVEASGFAKVKRENVVLQVSSPATLNLALAVKGGTITIDVSGEAPVVNTTDATLGNNFTTRQLTDLPAYGRDPAAILSLQPGVTWIGNEHDTQQSFDTRGGAVNGARSDQTNITLDGLDDNDQLQGYAFEGAMRPTMDSLQEFRVTTGNYDASSGRSSGAQINLVTKSGTNNFHGSLYAYNRPTFGVANDWFLKQAELSAGQANIPQRILLNTFGGTVGGPIKKDRLFFFIAYEGQRQASQIPTTREVPTQSLRDGELKYLCDPAPIDSNCTPSNSNVNVVGGGTLFPGFNVATLTPGQVGSLDTTCQSNGTCPPTPGNPNGGGPNGLLADLNGANPNALFTKYPLPNSIAEGDLLNSAAYTFAGNDPYKHDTYIVKLDYKINASGTHSLFVRGNLQNDHESLPPQFPGQPPFAFLTNNSKGIAAGYTAVIRNNLINNLRYEFIRQGLGNGGLNNQDFITFRGLDDSQGLGSQTTLTNVPVHNLVDDVSWTKGTHTIQFGTNWRFIHNNRQSNFDNVSYGETNLYWLNPSFIAGEGVSLDPSVDPTGTFPLVDENFGTSYSFAAMQVAGIISQVYTEANQNKQGQQIPNGELVPRHFQNFEGEMYLQDKWSVTPNLVVTYGLRYSLLQPPFENTGNQVAPTIDMHQWFTNRWQNQLNGDVVQPDLTFDLSGKANNGKPYWNWDYKNVAPRFAVAYSPHADGGFWHKVFGDAGKSSIRAGYGIYFDHFGEGVVNTFDKNGSWGLTSAFSNPASVYTVDDSPRYTGLTGLSVLQATGFLAPAPSGFPYTPPNDPNTYGLAIAWGIDDHLKTPYSHVVDFSITREFPHNFVLETTYTGRFGRHLLQEVDLAQPLDLVDPKSKTDYFTAAQQLSKAGAAGVNINNLAKIPYWEDMFPAAAGNLGFGPPGDPDNLGCAPGDDVNGNYTATQAMYDMYSCYVGNETSALVTADGYCLPACATANQVPFQYFQDQFSSLYAWQTRSNSNYNALQVTLRHPVGAGLEFDLNYVYSKSIDESSNAERANAYEGPASGGGLFGAGYNDQAINAFSPDQWRAVSDFDTTHQINANWIWDIPFGKGRRWSSHSSFANQLLGGWGLTGLYHWTSGFPFSVLAGTGWPTNFELEGDAVLVGPKPKTGVFVGPTGAPNVFDNPIQNVTCACPYETGGPVTFRAPYPGESGQRNNFRGPGYFDIDAGLDKTWNFSESKELKFAWEVFNVTNAVRFDAANALPDEDLVDITSFGNYQRTLTTPREMQFSLRFAF